jgi:hypothetical protein
MKAEELANKTGKWIIEYGNNTGFEDEGFWEWWTVTNGARSFKCDSEDDALFLRAALEQAAEPVPVGFVQALNEHNDEWVSKLPVGTALYTRPARKPMTRDDMRKLLAEHFDNGDLTGADFSLIRAVERFHDIKE